VLFINRLRALRFILDVPHPKDGTIPVVMQQGFLDVRAPRRRRLCCASWRP
jgi:hypothetical protein